MSHNVGTLTQLNFILYNLPNVTATRIYMYIYSFRLVRKCQSLCDGLPIGFMMYLLFELWTLMSNNLFLVLIQICVSYPHNVCNFNENDVHIYSDIFV